MRNDLKFRPMDNPLQEYEFLDLSDLGDDELRHLRGVLEPAQEHLGVELPWSDLSDFTETGTLSCEESPAIDDVVQCEWLPMASTAPTHIPGFAVPHSHPPPPPAFLPPPFFSSGPPGPCAWLPPTSAGESVNGGAHLELSEVEVEGSGDEQTQAPEEAAMGIPEGPPPEVVAAAANNPVQVPPPGDAMGDPSMLQGLPPMRAFHQPGPPTAAPMEHAYPAHQVYAGPGVYMDQVGYHLAAYPPTPVTQMGYDQGMDMQQMPRDHHHRDHHRDPSSRDQQSRGRGRKSMNKTREMGHPHAHSHAHPQDMMHGSPYQAPPQYYYLYSQQAPLYPIQYMSPVQDYPHPLIPMQMKPEVQPPTSHHIPKMASNQPPITAISTHKPDKRAPHYHYQPPAPVMDSVIVTSSQPCTVHHAEKTPPVEMERPKPRLEKPAMSGPPAGAVSVRRPAEQKKSPAASKPESAPPAAIPEEVPPPVEASAPLTQPVQLPSALSPTPPASAEAPQEAALPEEEALPAQPSPPTKLASAQAAPLVQPASPPQPPQAPSPQPPVTTSPPAPVSPVPPPVEIAPSAQIKLQEAATINNATSSAPQWGNSKRTFAQILKADELQTANVISSGNSTTFSNKPYSSAKSYNDNQKHSSLDGPQPVLSPSTQTGWGQMQPPRNSLSASPSPTTVSSKPSLPSGLPPPNPLDDPKLVRLGEHLQQYKLNHKAVSLLPRGLTNRSSWCYINATLQALLACPPFYNLMKSLPSSNSNRTPPDSKTPIIDCMRMFVNEFQALPSPARVKRSERNARNKDDANEPPLQPDKPFEPHYVYAMMTSFRPDTVVEGRQEDAEEFFSVLLNGLNDEMLDLMKMIGDVTPTDLTNGDVSTNGIAENLSQGDDEEWKVMGPKNKGSITRRSDFGRTPVSDIFRGQLRSRVVRQQQTDSITDNFQPFYTLQLNIEKASSVKKALEQYMARDQLEGVTCSRSNQEVLAWQEVLLEELPPVLVLHLKWFDYRMDTCSKIWKTFEFPVDLKLDSKMLSGKKIKTPNQQQYKLFAVVYHDGREATKGHYLTDAFHVGYSSWIRYDDNTVRQVAESEVLSPKSPRVPYLLYYRRQDTIVGH